MTRSRDRRLFELHWNVTWTLCDCDALGAAGDVLTESSGCSEMHVHTLDPQTKAAFRRTPNFRVFSGSWSVIRLELRGSSVCEVFGAAVEPFLLSFRSPTPSSSAVRRARVSVSRHLWVLQTAWDLTYEETLLLLFFILTFFITI